MVDPVITVIAGPGDAAAEQDRWSSLDGAWLEGRFEIVLGDEIFSFEEAP